MAQLMLNLLGKPHKYSDVKNPVPVAGNRDATHRPAKMPPRYSGLVWVALACAHKIDSEGSRHAEVDHGRIRSQSELNRGDCARALNRDA